MKFALFAAAGLAVALSSSSAFAAPKPKEPPPPPTVGTPCLLSEVSPAASACTGWYTGNLNGGSPDKLADTAYALNALLGTSYTAADFPFIEKKEDLKETDFTIDFDTLLYGDTVFSIHVGAAKGATGPDPYDLPGVSTTGGGTAFFRIDAGTTGLDLISLYRPGLSNAILYYTGTKPPCTGPGCDGGGGGGGGGVPEPGTWALMILGFGGAGSMLRRRRAALA